MRETFEVSHIFLFTLFLTCIAIYLLSFCYRFMLQCLYNFTRIFMTKGNIYEETFTTHSTFHFKWM